MTTAAVVLVVVLGAIALGVLALRWGLPRRRRWVRIARGLESPDPGVRRAAVLQFAELPPAQWPELASWVVHSEDDDTVLDALADVLCSGHLVEKTWQTRTTEVLLWAQLRMEQRFDAS